MLWQAVKPQGGLTPMKKLFTLLFAAALTVSLALPVFAQDSSQSSSSSSDSSMSSGKQKKAKKAKKSKKSDTKSDSSSTPQQ
jgi:flagellum-specific peptidoglycan hydrolase FlgJ